MIGWFLVGIFLFLAFINLVAAVRNGLSRCECERAPCPHLLPIIPFLGGLSGFFGMLLIPDLQLYSALPLLLDVGTLGVCFMIVTIFVDMLKTESSS